MNLTFFEAIQINPLLLYALTAGLLASIVGGIIGSYVVVKRIVFITGSIAHSVLGGIGFFLWLARTQGWEGLNPLYGAFLAAALSALLIGWINLNWKQREDSAIAALWSIGMAIGILFISQTPGFNVELTNFLIGNILWVTPQDLLLLALCDGAVILSVLLLHKRFLALSFDENQARLQGEPTRLLHMILLLLTSLSVVLLIQIVGIILVMTMMAIPAAIANLFTQRLSTMMLLAILFNISFCFFGTYLSYSADWPAGATIALTAGAAYLASLPLNKRTA